MSSFILGRRQHHDPVPVYLILMAGQAICFSLFFTIQLIYQVTVVGLNPLQMVLIGTVLEVTCFTFEVPTGIVADVYSRRLSILIGVSLIGCAYLLEGGFPRYWTALVGQVFWGTGYTFTSGAIEAWITDEIGEERVGPVFLRGRQMWLIGGLIGTVSCVLLGLVNVQLPMVVAGVGMFALATALLLVMPERHMRPTPAVERSTFGHMLATAQDGYRLATSRPVVKIIILISLFVGLAAEAFDRLSVPLVINRFDFPTVLGRNSPVIWFGISAVIGMLLSLGTSEIFKRKNPEALGAGTPARLLSFCSAIQVGAVVVYALSGSLWLSFAMLWTRSVANSVSDPVESAWLNRNLDASTRATVLSMTGQANSIGQAAGGPALGWVANLFSIPAALLCSAVILSPTVALYRRLIVRDESAVEAVPSPAD